ncbi:MAG: zinc ribbon domain-containing protein [Clostridium sp.]|uniref:zinc ribbon domain-containing protein n=1 Tax=Clostridium sp. TaxID=1506 RepID=UPI003D6D8AE5
MKGVLIIFPIIFIFLFIYLGQAFWIYLDGKRRGDEYVWLWSILSLISFPVPLIIYLIINRSGKRKCKNCGKALDINLKSCPYCGDNTKKQCVNCGNMVEKDWNFCPNCNEKLK